MKNILTLLFLFILPIVSYSEVPIVYPPIDKLPGQSDQAAVGADHFPSMLHAFVWRNWGLVPASRLSKVTAPLRKTYAK